MSAAAPAVIVAPPRAYLGIRRPRLSTCTLPVHRLASSGLSAETRPAKLAGMKAELGSRPFRGSQAIADGRVTMSQLRGPRFRRILHDVYIAASAPDSQRLRIQAATLRLPPDAVVTGRSAAHLWGAELGSLGDPVEIISATRGRSSTAIRARFGSIAGDEVVDRFGVRVPTPVHTAWELARTLPVLDAVAWIDALAAKCQLDTSQLVGHADRHPGTWRFWTALSTLELCDPRAESPPESMVRAGLITRGVVPAPTPQFVIRHNGVFVARVDLAWEEIRLALEYDGQWHGHPGQLSHDRERLRRINAAGWYVIHVTRNDLRDLDGLAVMLKDLIRSRILLFGAGRDPLSDLSSSED